MLFFGSLRDIMGKSADVISIPDGTSVSNLLQNFVRDKPALSALIPSLAVAVNEEYAARDLILNHEDEVGLLPPVSGGMDLKGEHCELVSGVIDPLAYVAPLKRGEDGAVVVFEGIVRNNSRGRKTMHMEYQAYDNMAVKQMDALVAQAKEKFSIDQAKIIHRIGELHIGEISVLIIVTSPHRVAAFESCRYLIDTLKKTVPIWKKEYFEDGVVWADGEPFPDHITPSKQALS